MKHEIVIEHSTARTTHAKVACQGKGCPLCASRAEDRARIAFVKPT